MARRGSMLGFAVVASLLAACSSSGDSNPATTTATPAAVASTEVPPPTSAPTTTQAPTTTIDPAEALAAEVEADLLEGLAAARTALMDPFDRVAEDEALDLRVGFARTNLETQLARWRDLSYAIRANPAIPPVVTVQIPARRVVGSDDVAQVGVCEVDSWLLVEAGGGPDGSEALVSPDTLTYQTTFFLRLVDGRWKIEGADETARWEGVTVCEASP